MNPLTYEQAEAIYDVLVEHAGAPERHREMFLHNQTHEFVSEWRFQGDLGFGGKFWRRPGAGGVEEWDVTCYPEDETPERTAIIGETNAALDRLRSA